MFVAVVIALAALPSLALSSGRDVLADYEDNGQIDNCYTAREYQEALALRRPDQAQYGATVEVIRMAQETKLVDRSGDPCPETVAVADPPAGEDGDGGVPTALVWVLVIAGVGLVAVGAGVWARRRPPGGDAGGGGPAASA